MRSDIVPGAKFPDYELTDHTGKRRTLSGLQGPDPMILTLSRGGFCPKDRRQMEGLLQLHREMEVGYCRLVTISTDNLLETNEFRSGVGAQWPFLTDAGRKVQKDLDIAEYTDAGHNPMIPHTIVLEPGLLVHKIYDGYWFFGRPTVEELRHDLRAVLKKCRADWDISSPEMRAAWEKGEKNRFFPYGKTYAEVFAEQDSAAEGKTTGADIRHQITIQATPQRVLAAITTQPGPSAWWTANCTVKPEVGFVNIFRFNGGNVEFHFRVDEQTPRHVAWTCVRAPKVPDEWVDTRLTFDLATQESGSTTLRFGHWRWRSVEGAYASSNTVWGELMHRLRAHAEGKPTEPYFKG